MTELRITSPAFANHEPIPNKFSCHGEDVNPPLAIAGVPPEAKSLALVMDDPDAPRGVWVHWVLWNIPPHTARIDENSVPSGAVQGVNSWGRTGYGGPCPPSGTHRYFFKLYALKTPLELHPGAGKAALEKAMHGVMLQKSELVGTFSHR